MGRWVCALCFRCFKNRVGKQALGPCGKAPVVIANKGGDKLVAKIVSMGHKLWSTCIEEGDLAVGNILFCSKCGAYTERRLGALVEPCTGKVEPGGPVVRLRRIRQGIHPNLARQAFLSKPVRLGALGLS